MKELGSWKAKTHKKLFQLDNPIHGRKYALVSYKLDGIDNLSASVFIWLTDDTEPPFKVREEIWFASGEGAYSHEEELTKAISNIEHEKTEKESK